MKDPIDPTPWETEPCAVLTNKQLNKLSIESTPEPGEGPTGPKCEWGDEFDDNISIDGSFSTKVESGIKDLYDNAELNTYAYFEQTEIGDHPAFFADITDARMNGSCGINIALKNDYIYGLGIRLHDDHPSYDEPCSVLKDVAEMAVDTMSGGGS